MGKLKIGKKYVIRVCDPGLKRESVRKGRLLAEHEHYVIVKFRFYKECFLKSDIAINHVVFKEV